MSLCWTSRSREWRKGKGYRQSYGLFVFHVATITFFLFAPKNSVIQSNLVGKYCFPMLKTHCGEGEYFLVMALVKPF
jgi:hypothetical protein